jgi:PleD family two-component response regulator
MLAPTDYEITEAENGEEALAAIAKQRPDLILIRSSQSPLMRSAVKKRRRGRRAAMITFRSPSAHVSYWRRLGQYLS